MKAEIFKIERNSKKLVPLRDAAMAEEGFKEAVDLENWLRNHKETLFGDQIVWIGQQNYLEDNSRSDLVGVDRSGNLVVVELKRGIVSKEVVSQVLAYASSYAAYNADQLADMAVSMDDDHDHLDVHKLLLDHVGADTPLNQTQILVLVGEKFDPSTLSICNYLNNKNILFRCCEYKLKRDADGQIFLIFSQILPAQTTEEMVKERITEDRRSKYARDPKRIEFMRRFIELAKSKGLRIRRSPGRSYDCYIYDDSSEENLILFSVRWDIYWILPEFPIGNIDESRFDLLEEGGKTWLSLKGIDFLDARQEVMEILVSRVQQILSLRLS